MKKQYLGGVLLSYGAVFFNVLTGILYTPWMVSEIGQSNYALYTLASSFVSMFLIDFGLGSAVSRFIAKYRAEGKEEKATELLGIVTFLYLIIDILAFIVLIVIFFMLEIIYKGLIPSELTVYKTLYIIVATFSLISFPLTPLSGILNAYEEFISIKLCEFGQKLLSVSLVVVSLFAGLGVVAVVTANAASGLIITVIRLVLVYRKTPMRFRFARIDRSLLREIFGFSIWVTIMSISQRCIFNFAPTLLGMVSTSAEIAIFAPANALEGYFYTFAAAVNGLFLAKVSKYIAESREDKIYSLLVSIGRYQMALMGMIFVGFVCIGRDFMRLWMGEAYLKAWPCALMLFIPDMLLFSQQIASTMALAKNKVKIQSLGYVGMAVVCLVLSFPLSKRFGVYGACFSITISYTLLFIYMTCIYHCVLKLNMIRFVKECYMRCLVPIVGTILLGYYLCNVVIQIGGWTGLILKGLIVIILYLALLRLFGLNRSEKQLIRIRMRSMIQL